MARRWVYGSLLLDAIAAVPSPARPHMIPCTYVRALVLMPCAAAGQRCVCMHRLADMIYQEKKTSKKRKREVGIIMAQHANTPPSSRRWAMVEMGQVWGLC
jgi:hypothetical protein